ncbi:MULTISPECIES: hypothetical protein [Sphingobacterium]|uniref:hypothetical protein n=1 Tax=Sphingobacterium TaxID=28453 RepID=UPI00129C13D2|nr:MULTISPECIES: hypothetical protein [Sphingobacterium]MBB1645905.1 hypothetical protein [Sphingobacterium sp. UME9]MCS4166855.1 hypothetical protein [Sphingobacterium sp. BIGb0116]WET70238.1 MAG: hypothetical protein P0Y57_03935 [Sphingobacterium sp.]
MKEFSLAVHLLLTLAMVSPSSSFAQKMKALSGDFDFVGIPNSNDRIAEGYAKTAKSLAKLITKKIK